MSATVNVHEAKTNLSKLLERAHGGEEIIVAKAGKPYARLVPLEAATQEPRKPGRFRHLLGTIDNAVLFEPMSDDDLDAWDGKYSHIL
ncbi:type II toxin-antitoxin system Phd/YefM family antitoxin [Sphingomonas profundi]|uniref:type II toxin-antitoxin system Phd/YefM family antitoxin n=1 Tax=Alterirhizorhabdus profundi TaxID=2681549 RepID=UPI0012E976CC|nr:type II toxin-antitoxin system prevent-host-death family antitoxin [Sphingomonas profundi]